jgi:hypothetical protein
LVAQATLCTCEGYHGAHVARIWGASREVWVWKWVLRCGARNALSENHEVGAYFRGATLGGASWLPKPPCVRVKGTTVHTWPEFGEQAARYGLGKWGEAC